MPLKLIECVLPWFVGSLSEEEAKFSLQNMRLAGASSELVTRIISCITTLQRHTTDILHSMKFSHRQI